MTSQITEQITEPPALDTEITGPVSPVPPQPVPVYWQPPPPGRKQAPVAPPGVRRTIGLLVLAAMFLLGFVVYLYGLSGVIEDRTQNTLYKTFAGQLSQATAPVGTATEGDPVAVLSIPKLNLDGLVVVEGTSSVDLAAGPGHVVASALPGQAGVSVLYGKAITYGGPFAHLEQLDVGDAISVVTGQGRAVYRVASFGENTRPAPDTSPNRLVLESTNSATDPSVAVQVTADLESPPQPNPGGRPQVPTDQQVLATDTAEVLVPLVLWSQALLLVSVLGTVAARYWSRWPAYLCAIPVVLAVVWHVYQNLAGLLPNVY
jgi:sortase A